VGEHSLRRVIAVVAIWLSHRREDFVRLMPRWSTFAGVDRVKLTGGNRQETELANAPNSGSARRCASETTAHAGDVDWDAYRLMMSSDELPARKIIRQERMMAQVCQTRASSDIRRPDFGALKTQYAITHFATS
jgi:hypothetical protein